VWQSRTYYIYIFGKDVNNFDYLVIWQEATWLLKGVSIIYSSNSPKLAEIKTVQRMATDGHRVSTIAKDFTLTGQTEFRILEYSAGATGRRYSVISIVDRTGI
jgi:DNA invertase Pin-like site-specific DNA recombinase